MTATTTSLRQLHYDVIAGMVISIGVIIILPIALLELTRPDHLSDGPFLSEGNTVLN